MIKKIFAALLFVFISTLSNTTYAEEYDLEKEIKLSMQRLYNLDFSEHDVIISNNDSSIDKNLIIKGYSLKNPENEKLTAIAANTDLIRNYAGFIKGWTYELNNGQLKLVFDDNIKLKNVDGKYINEDIYQASCNLSLSDKFLNSYSSRPSIFVYSKIEIKNSILNAYSEARNKAIIHGLNEFYSDKSNKNIKGKILFQKVLYNSLDESLSNIKDYYYIVKFTIVN